MKISKRLIVLFLILALCLSMTACGKKDDKVPQENIQEQVQQQAPVQDVVEETPAPEPEPEPEVEQTPEPGSEQPASEPEQNIQTSENTTGQTYVYEPEINIMFDTGKSIWDKMTFGENAVELFEPNAELLTNSVTEYMADTTKQIQYNGEDVFAKTYNKPSSNIAENIYFTQGVNHIGISFAATVNNNITREEIEQFTETARMVSGVFVSDMDLYDVIEDTIGNFKNYKKDAKNKLSATIWGSDNTQFISVKTTAYEKDGMIQMDISINVMVNNADLKYLDNIRINFDLSNIKLNNDSAIIGSVIGYSPAGKDFTSMDICKGIIRDMTMGEDSINIKEAMGTPFVPATKETDAGLAYDFSNLKGKFDFKGFAASNDSTAIIASDLYGFSTCNIPITDGGMFDITVNIKNSNYFTIDMAYDLFIDEVYFFTGYKLSKTHVETVHASVRDGFSYVEFELYHNGEETGYVVAANYNSDGTTNLRFSIPRG